MIIFHRCLKREGAMRFSVPLVGLAVLAVCGSVPLAGGPASAQTQQQKDWCFKSDSTNDQTIIGCTAVIGSGNYTGRDLAVAFYDRGFGYDERGKANRDTNDFSR